MIASATLWGSAGSRGGGVLLVFTAQNEHPRVQVSPINIIVAVAVPSLPPQHSPIFGHLASSQTVARLSDFTVFDSLSKFSFRSPVGVSIRSQSGFAGSFRADGGACVSDLTCIACSPANSCKPGASASSARSRCNRDDLAAG